MEYVRIRMGWFPFQTHLVVGWGYGPNIVMRLMVIFGSKLLKGSD